MEHYEQLKNGAPKLDGQGNVVGFESLLYWNDLYKQYELTPDAVKNELGFSIDELRGNIENGKIYLKEIALIVYTYIYKKKPAVLQEKTQYLLTYDMKARRVLFECMIDMMRYAITNGGNIIGYLPGVNPNESGILDIEKMRDERIVSYVTDGILKTQRFIDRNFIEKFDLPEEW